MMKSVALLPSMQKLTKRGIELSIKLRSLGVPVIESYPGVVQDIIGLPRKQASLTLLKKGLGIFGLKGKFLKENVSHAKVAIANKDNAALQMIEENMIDLEKKISMLQQELYLDELTHLYNRRWLFEKYLDNDSFTQTGTFCFIDINNFKHINDNYGHLVGDKVLSVLGKVLLRIEKSSAIRYAGDEFIVISHEHGAVEMEKILDTVNNNLKNTNLKHHEKIFHVDFAFGVSAFTKGDSFKTILEDVDEKMYRYKKSNQ